MCPTGIPPTWKYRKSKSFLIAFFMLCFPLPEKEFFVHVFCRVPVRTIQTNRYSLRSGLCSDLREEQLKSWEQWTIHLLSNVSALSLRFLVTSIFARYQSFLNLDAGATLSGNKFSMVFENLLQTWMSRPSGQGENSNDYYKERNPYHCNKICYHMLNTCYVLYTVQSPDTCFHIILTTNLWSRTAKTLL